MNTAVALAGAGVVGVVFDPDDGAIEVGGEGSGFEIVFGLDMDEVACFVVGVDVPLVVLWVETADVGDAVGGDADVFEFDGIVVGVGDTGAGDAVLFNYRNNGEACDVAVTKQWYSEGELEDTQAVFGGVAFEVVYDLDGVDVGGVEAGFDRGGVLALRHDIDTVEVQIGRHLHVALESFTGAEAECQQCCKKYDGVFFRFFHSLRVTHYIFF